MALTETVELKSFAEQGRFSSIKQRSTAIYKTMNFSDCSFRVGSDNNQKVLKAHKLVLSMASVVFEAMFFGKLAEENYPIAVPDIEPNTFAMLLEYLYTDHIILKTFDDAIDMCYAAQKYLLTSVVDHCVSAVRSKLNTSNVLKGYRFAKMYEKSDIKDACVRMIKSQTSKVLTEAELVGIDISMLANIFQLDDLNINCELELFGALERYIKANEQTSSLDIIEYREILKHIRFLAMTPRDFTEGPGCSQLLTEQEKLSLLMNISSTNIKSTPIPQGFSANRNVRRVDSCVQRGSSSATYNFGSVQSRPFTSQPPGFGTLF